MGQINRTRIPPARYPFELADTLAHESDPKGRGHVLRHVLAYFFMAPLSPKHRSQHPGHSWWLSGESPGLGSLVERHRKSAVAKHVKHHVHVVQSQFLADLVQPGFFGKYVPVKPQTVPCQQGVAALDKSHEFTQDLPQLGLRHSFSRRPITLAPLPDDHIFRIASQSGSTCNTQGTLRPPVEIGVQQLLCRLNIECKIHSRHEDHPHSPGHNKRGTCCFFCPQVHAGATIHARMHRGKGILDTRD